MSDRTDEEIAEEIETKAMVRALGLVQVIADAAGAAKRMQALAKATAEHTAASDKAAKLVAEADSKTAARTAAEASLNQRIAEFQRWTDAQERSFREREDRIRTNEESQTAREAKLVAAEDDFTRRVAAHQEQVRKMRAHLGAVA
jgi:hypothetical protein